MRTKFIRLSAAATLVLLDVAWVAGQSVPGLPGAPSQAPIGGLSILAAAGVGYAMYKLKNRHKE